MNKAVREGFVTDDPVVDPVVTPEPQADEEPELIKEEWPIKVKLLNKPIRGNKNEELKELSFREPTGADINRVGNPVRVTLDGEIMIDDKRMMLMMTALSGVMTPFLDRMDPRDYASCAYRLRNFFLPNLAAW
jgi:hypothetical protein